MKIKIDAGYRSIDISKGVSKKEGGGLELKEVPYVKADIDIDIEFVKYFNHQWGDNNSNFHKALESALMHICSQIARGAQVF
jgi:hypothetical protein